MYLLLFVVAILGILASIALVSLNVAREKGIDATVKLDLSAVQAQASVDYDVKSNSYAKMFTDPAITAALSHAVNAVQANPVGHTSDTAYVIYLPLKRPTAPATGWCIDSTGASRESVNPGTATVCP